MNEQELKKEILERYRDKIAADDFELLIRDAPPSIDDLNKSNSILEYLGSFGEFGVWLTRKLFGANAGVLTIIVTLAGAIQLYFTQLHPTVVKSLDYVTTYITHHTPTAPDEQPKPVWFYPDPATVPPTGSPSNLYATSIVAPVSGQFLNSSGWAPGAQGHA